MRALPSISLALATALAAALATTGCDVVTGFLAPPPVVESRDRGGDDDADADVDCADDGDCNGGEVCVDDVCVGVCDSDRDCDGGTFCDDGRCRAPDCVDDSDCRGGFACVDLACVALGEGEGEEGEGEGGEGEEGEGEGEGEEGEGEEGEGALTIELTWSTDDDDVDVHFSRAAPPTFCSADDCSYRNKTTTWGARMDLDDLDGFGPERIGASGLADGSYTVLVDGYTIDATTTATLQVFVGAELVFQDARTLRDGDHWLVARVDVDGGVASVVALDRVARQAGSCLGPAPAGASCTTDAGCDADEFCDVDGRCAVGCRSDAGCAAGQTCSANGVCLSDGALGYGAACSETVECVEGLTCGIVTGTCVEFCEGAGDACGICDDLSGRPCSCLVIATVGICTID